MSRKAVVGLILAILLVGGVVSIILLNSDEGSGDDNEGNGESVVDEARHKEVINKRGPRPKSGILPEGVSQVEETGKAISMAQEALKRVEREMASATDDKTKVQLERKKQIIEQSILRLSGSVGSSSP